MKHTEYIIPLGEEAKDYDEMFIGIIRKQKELIRCKDCKHYYRFDGRCYLWSINRRENGYCDRAERKEECPL